MVKHPLSEHGIIAEYYNKDNYSTLQALPNIQKQKRSSLRLSECLFYLLQYNIQRITLSYQYEDRVRVAVALKDHNSIPD